MRNLELVLQAHIGKRAASLFFGMAGLPHLRLGS